MNASIEDPEDFGQERGLLDLWAEIVRTATLVRSQARLGNIDKKMFSASR